MLIAGVLCLCAAAASAVLGARALARPVAAAGPQAVLRTVAPTQLAAAVMLAAGGVVAVSNHASVGLLALCVAGAVGTVAAGAWQGARAALAHERACQRGGEGPCATCTLSCN